MKIQVKIINHFTSTKEDFQLLVLESDMESIKEIHKDFSKENPNCSVNFTWGKNFICGMPHNQEIDEEKLDRLDITFDEYMNKWYK